MAPRGGTERNGGIVIIFVVVAFACHVECLLYRNLLRDSNYFFVLFFLCCMTFVLSAKAHVVRNRKIEIENFNLYMKVLMNIEQFLKLKYFEYYLISTYKS